MTNIIAKRYAQALFDLAAEKNEAGSVFHDTEEILNVLNVSKDFEEFIHQPLINDSKKEQVLNGIFNGKIKPLTLDFLNLLAEKKRLPYLREVCLEFKKLHNHSAGIQPVLITTSIELNQHQIQSIERHLKDKINKTIHSETVCDNSILGGVKIKVNDTIFDHSIKTQLDELRENIIKA